MKKSYLINLALKMLEDGISHETVNSVILKLVKEYYPNLADYHQDDMMDNIVDTAFIHFGN